ncbi:MarR family winged helix-turn-helix transcriptional regulator [Trebonia sp.]|uniref:MarR family winged helix-turn-helix transcriptional regulator n=1 Tax=Trebonia sp. TaxID=2767075 RepID=UPI00262B5A4E|nr:MarR family winged helix-turn-helix transcriptional regulator [Trebonia sp.]
MRPPGSPEERHPSLDSKIVAALDRVGDALQVLARRAAGAHDLSPTQMRVLVRLYYGPPPDAVAGELAREFDVADPTMSDALSALARKGLIDRSPDPADRRRHVLGLTAAGRAVAHSVARWTAPAEVASSGLSRSEGEGLLSTLLDLLERMHAAGMLSVARTCTTCGHFERGSAPGAWPARHRCAYYGYPMSTSDLRVDCAEHVARGGSGAARG